MKRRSFFLAVLAVMSPMHAPESVFAFTNRMMRERGLQLFTVAVGQTVEAGQLVALQPDGTVAPVRGAPWV